MPRKKHCYHYLYKTTNLINGKYYYGMHSTSNLDDDYLGSGKRLRYSIRKYGKENFKREILQMYDSREELVQGEIEFITEDLLKDPICMNIKPGGTGGWTDEQQRLNQIKSTERQAWLKENDPEWFEKKQDACRHVLYTKLENGKLTTLHFHDWTGKQHKEETKQKIGQANSIKQKGEGNSQFDTCWITKDNENKKIKKEELDSFILQGWSKGRKTSL